jgi:putative peptide zinc metalloprotease protein
MDLIRSRLRAVQVRLANDLSDAVPARVRRQVTGGEFDLVSPALGTSGGGEIAVDPSQTGGMHSLKRVFDVEVALERPSRAAVFGDRAYVRFDLGLAPLGWQWYLRLRQVFLSQLNL